MSSHPLELSTRVIDSGVVDQPLNRVTNEITELADGLAIVESFSHSAVFDTGDGLICFDASGAGSGKDVVNSIRSWRKDRISNLIYTHGHADHIGGSFAFAADATEHNFQKPHVIGHENVNTRIDRYTQTSDWNIRINQRQFGGIRSDMGLNIGENLQRFLPRSTMRPDETFRESHIFEEGGTQIELHHARGETDDHLWAWMPEKKWLFSGDFEWAQALRRMIAQGPELLVPAHGLPIEGKKRIAMVLDDIASSLESLVTQVIEMMNRGETLDTIIHTVKVPQIILDKPYMRPLYDEPEFVVRNIWRLYGGWWDGAPSRLKPAPDAQVATELANLSGGAENLMKRALELMDNGDIRMACHLADFAGWAAPEDPGIHANRATIYERRRKNELSLMSKGIFKGAARESKAIAET
jgi:glyoxylase-like metal-dependent hydrolase (beta-lactamase superfamily II)